MFCAHQLCHYLNINVFVLINGASLNQLLLYAWQGASHSFSVIVQNMQRNVSTCVSNVFEKKGNIYFLFSYQCQRVVQGVCCSSNECPPGGAVQQRAMG